jgi:hypothetical protein
MSATVAEDMAAAAPEAHDFADYVLTCLGKDVPPNGRLRRHLARKAAVGILLLRKGPEYEWDARRLKEHIPVSPEVLRKMIKRVQTGPVQMAFLPVADDRLRGLLACIDDVVKAPVGLKELDANLRVDLDEVALVSDPQEAIRRFRDALQRRNARGVAPISQLTEAQLRGARHCWLGRGLDEDVPLGDVLGGELGAAVDSGLVVSIDMTAVDGVPFTSLVMSGKIIDFVPDFETEDAAVSLLQRLVLETRGRPLAVVRDSAAAYDSLSFLTWLALQGIVSVVALSANDSPADKAFRNERRHLVSEQLRKPYATIQSMRALATANWDALVPQAKLIPATPAQLAAARYRAFRLGTNRRGSVSVDGTMLRLDGRAPDRVLVGIRTVDPLAVGRSCRAVAEALHVAFDLPSSATGRSTLRDGVRDLEVLGSVAGMHHRKIGGNRFVAGEGNREVKHERDLDVRDKLSYGMGMGRVRDRKKGRGATAAHEEGGEAAGAGATETGEAVMPAGIVEVAGARTTPSGVVSAGAVEAPDSPGIETGEGSGTSPTEPPAFGMFPGPGEALLLASGNDVDDVDHWRRFAPFAPALMRWKGSDLEPVAKARIDWERPRPVRVVTTSKADRPELVRELRGDLDDVIAGARSSRRMAELLDHAEDALRELGELGGVDMQETYDTIRHARALVSLGRLDDAVKQTRLALRQVRRIRT